LELESDPDLGEVGGRVEVEGGFGHRDESELCGVAEQGARTGVAA
jgi:hypothetical protein